MYKNNSITIPPTIYNSQDSLIYKVVDKIKVSSATFDTIISNSITFNKLIAGPLTITNDKMEGLISINGVTIEKHADRHSFSGLDPLIPALINETTEISDATASSGISNRLARADHTHSHGQREGGTSHAHATSTSAGFMSSTEKVKLDFSLNPSDVVPNGIYNTPSPGTGNNYSRSDHTHEHGNLTDGNLHAVANSTTNGFLHYLNKQKLNQLNINGSLLEFSGYVSLSYPIYCTAEGTEVVNIPQGVYVSLTENYYKNPQLNGIMYNGTNYLIPFNGVYRINLNPVLYFSTSGTIYTISITINGINSHGLNFTNNYGNNTTIPNISTNLYLNTNDSIGINIIHINGLSGVTTQNTINNKLTIIKIS